MKECIDCFGKGYIYTGKGYLNGEYDFNGVEQYDPETEKCELCKGSGTISNKKKDKIFKARRENAII